MAIGFNARGERKKKKKKKKCGYLASNVVPASSLAPFTTPVKYTTGIHMTDLGMWLSNFPSYQVIWYITVTLKCPTKEQEIHSSFGVYKV